MLRVRNPALWWVAGGAAVFLALTLSVRVGRELFRFSPVHVDDLVISVIAGLVPVLMFEAVVVEGWASRNGSATANASSITFADGRRLFAGTSNTAAPSAP